MRMRCFFFASSGSCFLRFFVLARFPAGICPLLSSSPDCHGQALGAEWRQLCTNPGDSGLGCVPLNPGGWFSFFPFLCWPHHRSHPGSFLQCLLSLFPLGCCWPGPAEASSVQTAGFHLCCSPATAVLAPFLGSFFSFPRAVLAFLSVPLKNLRWFCLLTPVLDQNSCLIFFLEMWPRSFLIYPPLPHSV